ncbi:MAG: hypothetical protein H5U08_03905 [Thermogutta sp.]|uniref:hypothetical protein n=1 Tax=Thermogutta sp. TaxID=1962930 RepID=UPI0019A7D7FA|nr:hypothetical protein [Thermogutta sp.]MBC7351482.1 hypothetical protein [Thermogutta sp.]
MARVIWDIENWYRLGRGRVFDFRATGEQVVQALQAGLPEQWAPYVLVNVIRVKRDKTYEPQVSYYAIEELPAVATEENWQFFVMSKVISGNIDVSAVGNPDSFCSLNGMIILFYPKYPSLGIVNKVECCNTGEIIEHTEYFQIYRKLARAFNPYKTKK